MDQILTLRKVIDEIDNKLIGLISKRADVAKKIGEIKKENGVQVADKKREDERISKMKILAAQNELNQNEIENIWRALFEISYDKEENE